MKKVNRYVSLFLSIVMLLEMLPLTRTDLRFRGTPENLLKLLTMLFPTASAEGEVTASGSCNEDVSWSLMDGVLTVSGTGKIPAYSLDVPAEWQQYAASIREVEVASGVNSIGKYAFAGLNQATSVSVSDSVTSIGLGAFRGCESLTEITLPFVGRERGLNLSTRDNIPEMFGYIFDYTEQETAGTTYQTWYTDGYNRHDCYFFIPASLRKVTLTDMTEVYDYAFVNCSMLTQVKLPAGLASISSYAFQECSGLASVNLPETLTSIGSYAFQNCAGLTRVETPASLTSIGSNAFDGCTGLQQVDLKGASLVIGRDAFLNCSGVTSLVLNDGVQEIEAGAFQGMGKMTKITVPKSVTEIGGGVFRGWDSLTEMTLPFIGESRTANPNPDKSSAGLFGYIFGCTDQETPGTTYQNTVIVQGYMENYAYKYYYYIPTGLRKVIITDADHVSSCAFLNCSMLSSVSLNEGMTSIASSGFQNCSGLTRLDLPSTLLTIGDSACQGCTSLQYANIPGSVTTIGDSAFQNCAKLQNVVIPPSVTSIGRHTFAGCASFTAVSIPGSVKTIGTSAFADCSAVTELTIENGVQSISDQAFAGMGKVPTVEVPVSVQDMGSSVFRGWDSLTDLTVPFVGSSRSPYLQKDDITHGLLGYFFGATTTETPGTIYQTTVIVQGYLENYAYNYYYYIPKGLRKVTITDATQICGSAFINCSMLQQVSFGAGITEIGGSAFANCSGLTSLNLPASLTIINGSAFANCKNLKKVTIPDQVEEISSNAFQGCAGLTEILIPESVKHIGSSAFEGCTGLMELVIPGSVTKIGSSAFENCSGVNALTIENGVQTIGQSAFAGMKALTTVVVPKSVTSIGAGAFRDCMSLREMTLPFVGASRTPNVSNIDDTEAMFGYLFGSTDAPAEGAIYQTTVMVLGIMENRAYRVYYYVPTSLRKVTITDASSIHANAFRNCSFLTQIKLNDGISAIGSYAFENCSGLTDLYLPEGISSVPYGMLQDTNLSYIGVPDSLTDPESLAYKTDAVWLVYSGSDAEEFARKNDIDYQYYSADGGSVLTVVAKPGVGWEKYAGTTLEIRGENSVSSFAIGEKTAYQVFLSRGETCSVQIVNAYDDVLAKSAPLTLENERHQIILDDMAAVGSVCLRVRDAAYTLRNEEGDITWTDAAGNVYATGADLHAVPLGKQLTVSFVPGAELSKTHETPEPVALTVTDARDLYGMSLAERQPHLFTGTVADAQGQVLAGAIITAEWTAEGHQQQVETLADAQGKFQLTAFAADIALHIGMPGYAQQSISCGATGNSTDLGTIRLPAVKGTGILLTLSQQLLGASSPAQVTDWQDMVFCVTAKESGAVLDATPENGMLVLGSGVQDGLTVMVTVSSTNSQFAPVQTEATLAADATVTAQATIVPYGQLQASWSNPEVAVTALVFDAASQLVWSGEASGGMVTTGRLPDGGYTLVLLGADQFTQIPQTLQELADAGLVMGVDYLSNQANAVSGSMATLSMGKVPQLTPARYSYVDADNSGMILSKESVIVGTRFSIKANAVLLPEYQQRATDFRWVFTYPESCVYWENSLVVIDGDCDNIQLGDDQLTFETDDPSCTARFCLSPQETGDMPLSGYLEFTLDGERVRQPLGTLHLTSEPMTFILPTRVHETKVQATGHGPEGATVTLFANEAVVGKTQVVGSSWKLDFTLPEPYTYATYRVYALVELPQGVKVRTVEQQLVYQAMESPIKLSHVTMNIQGSNIIFDFLSGDTSRAYYSFISGEPFTFRVYFEGEDQSQVKSVSLNVHLSNGGVSVLTPSWSEEEGCWIVSTEYGSAGLPVNVGVEYSTDTEILHSPEENADNIDKMDKIDQQITIMAETTYRDVLEWERASFEVFKTLDPDELMQDGIITQDEYDDMVNRRSEWQTDMSEYQAAKLTFNEQYNIAAESFTALSKHVQVTDAGITLDAGGTVVTYSPPPEITDTSLVAFSRGTATEEDLATLVESLERLVATARSIGPGSEYLTFSAGSGGADATEEFLSQMNMTMTTGIGAVEVVDEMIQKKMPDLYNKVNNHSVYAKQDLEKMAARYKQWAEMEVDPVQKQKWLSRSEQYGAKAASYDVNVGKCSKVMQTVGKANTVLGIAGLYSSIQDWRDSRKLMEEAKGTSAELEATCLHIADWLLVGLAFGTLVCPLSWPVAGICLIAGIVTYFQRKNLKDRTLELLDKHNHSQTHSGTSVSGSVIVPGIDPHGFVYEAVASNRLSGVIATCYQKVTEYDIYDEPYEVVREWDASESNQKNPQKTGEEGRFGWDVPQGLWQIVCEKEGYETGYSEWMTVPPERYDVNIGMVSLAQPELASLRAGTDGLELVFSKYMKTDFDDSALTVQIDGQTISGTWIMRDREVDPTKAETYYVSTLRFVPDQALTPGGTVSVTTKAEMYSYAEVSLPTDSSISAQVSATTVTSKVVLVPAGREYLLATLVSSLDSATLTYTSADEEIVTTAATGMLKGVTPGMTQVTAIDGIGKTETFLVKVHSAGLKVPLPLVEIAAEAFQGTAADSVELGANIQRIGAHAFADCMNLVRVVIPPSVTDIDPSAFTGSPHVTICAPEGSYAHQYALDAGLDWFNGK